MDKPTYDRPEPGEERASRAWIYLLLALLVVGLLVVIATQGYLN